MTATFGSSVALSLILGLIPACAPSGEAERPRPSVEQPVEQRPLASSKTVVGGLKSSHITYEVSEEPVSTDSDEFITVDSLRGIPIAHSASVGVAVTVVVSGGAAEFRVVRLPSKVLIPSSSPVFPAADSPSTFTLNFLSREKDTSQCHTYELQWRASGNELATIESASVMMYHHRSREIVCG